MPHVTDINKITDLILRSCEIISQFENIVRSEIVEKQGILPLSSTYEGLGSALAYLGSALESLGSAESDGMPKHVIGAVETRQMIEDSYRACSLAVENLKPGSELANAAMYLESCFYSMLDARYTTPDTAQEAIGRVLEICECGDRALSDIESVSADECSDQYKNPDGQTLHMRLFQFRETFDRPRPKYDPDTSDATGVKGSDA